MAASDYVPMLFKKSLASHGASTDGFFGLGEASETARIEAQRARADFRALLVRGA